MYVYTSYALFYMFLVCLPYAPTIELFFIPYESFVKLNTSITVNLA